MIPDWLGLSHMLSSVTGGTFSNTESEGERSIFLEQSQVPLPEYSSGWQNNNFVHYKMQEKRELEE